jgi:hypothetical protein
VHGSWHTMCYRYGQAHVWRAATPRPAPAIMAGSYASTLMALFLPISLSPFLVIMNDPTHVGAKTNGRAANVALVGVLHMAFVVAAVVLPLMVLSGGA